MKSIWDRVRNEKVLRREIKRLQLEIARLQAKLAAKEEE